MRKVRLAVVLVALFGAALLFAWDPAPVAADDVVGTITPDGTPVTVTITTPGQNARLTFGGAAEQRVSVWATDSSFGGGCCPPGHNQVALAARTLQLVTTPKFVAGNMLVAVGTGEFDVSG